MALSKADQVTVGPFRVFFDKRDRVIAKKLILYGGFETREIDLLCSFTQPGDVALDVGANIGLYSLALSRAVGPTGRVVAVEPDPDNLALLRRNLQVNGCDNVTVIQDAFGEESKEVLLYESEDNRGALSTSDIFGVGPDRAIRIHMHRGDTALSALGVSPRICKIDVEGAEPQVIAGLGKLLPEVLLFEFVPWQLRAAGHNPATFLHQLTKVGYRLSLVDPDTGKHTSMNETEIVCKVEALQADRNVLAQR